MDDDKNSIGISIEGLEKAMEDASKMAFAYYSGLMTEGFPHPEAYELTRDYMEIWWKRILSQKDGE